MADCPFNPSNFPCQMEMDLMTLRRAERESMKILQFRTPKIVSDLMLFQDTSFFVCPQCGITLEREFMKYCDRCGQCLNWKNYKHPRIVYPGSHGG